MRAHTHTQIVIHMMLPQNCQLLDEIYHKLHFYFYSQNKFTFYELYFLLIALSKLILLKKNVYYTHLIFPQQQHHI